MQWAPVRGDYSLEAYIRRVAMQPEAPTGRLNLHTVPADVMGCLHLIQYTKQIPVRSASGEPKERAPRMWIIEEAMTLCGMHELEALPVVQSAHSRYTDELLYGRPEALYRQSSYSFAAQGVLSGMTVRCNAELTEDTLGRLATMARDLHLPASTLAVACWVAAIARSEDWVSFRAESCARALRGFVAWLEAMQPQ